jgi:hypothetical protein
MKDTSGRLCGAMGLAVLTGIVVAGWGPPPVLAQVFFGTPAFVNTDGVPGGFRVGDMDGDGLPDLVVSSPAADLVSVYLNSLSRPGTFDSSIISTATGGGPGPVATGDLNGDGLPDIVTANGPGPGGWCR